MQFEGNAVGIGRSEQSERRAGLKAHRSSFCVLNFVHLFCVRKRERLGNAEFVGIKITFLG